MKMLPTRAAKNAPTLMSSTCWTAAAVPTSTGAIAAGSVRVRAAMSHNLTRSLLRFRSLALQTSKSRSFALASGGGGVEWLWPPGVLAEIRLAALDVRVPPLLALLGHVEAQRRVVGELLQAGQAVLGGVEARLQKAQRQRREVPHLATPRDRLALELAHRDHGVDEPHVERLLSVVEATQEPDLLGLLDAHVAGEQRGAEASVEAADARPGLPEPRVVRGDGHVADQVQDVATPHRVAGHRGDHRLRRAADLDV